VKGWKLGRDDLDFFQVTLQGGWCAPISFPWVGWHVFIGPALDNRCPRLAAGNPEKTKHVRGPQAGDRTFDNDVFVLNPPAHRGAWDSGPFSPANPPEVRGSPSSWVSVVRGCFGLPFGIFLPPPFPNPPVGNPLSRGPTTFWCLGFFPPFCRPLPRSTGPRRLSARMVLRFETVGGFPPPLS